MRTLLSTAELPPVKSFQCWQEVFCDRIGLAEMTKIGERPFEGTLEGAEVGSMLINRVTQTTIRAEVTAETIRRHGNFETLTITIILSGSMGVDHCGRSSILHGGDIFLLDSRPATVLTQGPTQTLNLQVPRDRVAGMLGSPRLYAGLTVGASQAGTSLVRTFFDELIRVGSRFDPATADRMSAIGVDLLVASIAERLAQEVPKPLHGTVVLQRAKAYIEENLGDPSLDPPQLAAAMGVSLRRLQELFHEHGRHVSDWIWQRRLATAAARLADPGYRHLPIGSLAYGCGFSTQAHFGRRFRDRYGMTPSECRRGLSRIEDSN